MKSIMSLSAESNDGRSENAFEKRRGHRRGTRRRQNHGRHSIPLWEYRDSEERREESTPRGVVPDRKELARRDIKPTTKQPLADRIKSAFFLRSCAKRPIGA
jgi:hypothetical protein